MGLWSVCVLNQVKSDLIIGVGCKDKLIGSVGEAKAKPRWHTLPITITSLQPGGAKYLGCPGFTLTLVYHSLVASLRWPLQFHTCIAS